MKNRVTLWALIFAVATISVQCSTEKSDVPEIPSSIEQFFKPGSYSDAVGVLNYQECEFKSSRGGKLPLVVVLHGQYAKGSDNKKQLNQSAMIHIWNTFNTNNVNVVMLAPQCPAGFTWDEDPGQYNRLTTPERLKNMLDAYISKNSDIDTSRIYIIGYTDGHNSSGAGGVWRMLAEYTDMFASGIVLSSEPEESISPSKVALTPVLFIKSVASSSEATIALDTFGDLVRDKGGVFREVVISEGNQDEFYRKALSAENLSWAMQYTKE
jgi:predicted peptidase